MKAQFLILSVAASMCSTAMAAPSNHFESLAAELSQFLQTTSGAELAPAVQACWKHFGHKEPTMKKECDADVNGELSFGQCYEKCQSGYEGFGPFCLAKPQKSGKKALLIQQEQLAVEQSYERQPVGLDGSLVDGTCPAQTRELGGQLCVKTACPAQLPANCGVICTKDTSACTQIAGEMSVLILQLSQKIQAGDVAGSFILAKRLFDRVKPWPKCSALTPSLQEQERSIDAEFVDRLLELVQQMNHN